jgi:hypothetical protein
VSQPTSTVSAASTASVAGAGLSFFQLPVAADQGLPQAFSCTVGVTSYDFGVYASINVGEADPPQTLYDLSSPSELAAAADPPGYLVLRIARQGAAGPQVIFLRKLVPEPGLVHYGAELAVKVTTAILARGNLNGTGSYGSQILIGVAQRWA